MCATRPVLDGYAELLRAAAPGIQPLFFAGLTDAEAAPTDPPALASAAHSYPCARAALATNYIIVPCGLSCLPTGFGNVHSMGGVVRIQRVQVRGLGKNMLFACPYRRLLHIFWCRAHSVRYLQVAGLR